MRIFDCGYALPRILAQSWCRLGGAPPIILTMMDNGDCSRAFIYSYYATITRWGALLSYRAFEVGPIYGWGWRYRLQGG